jgi:hypothetical protein
VLLGAGVLLGIAGTALGLAFGPDDRLELGPEDYTSAGPSIATAPEAIAWAGPVVEITAERADDGPVFVGVGPHVDVADYLARTTYTRIDDVSFPWDATTTPVNGPDSPGAPPSELDWWLADAEGPGRATVRLPLPESAIDVVVMDPSLRTPLEVAVTVAWVQDGAFLLAIGMVVVAVGLGLAGRRVARA